MPGVRSTARATTPPPASSSAAPTTDRSATSAMADTGISAAHVDDVAAGIVAALDRGRIGEAYVLARREPAAHRRHARSPHAWADARCRASICPPSLVRLGARAPAAIARAAGLPEDLGEVMRASIGRDVLGVLGQGRHGARATCRATSRAACGTPSSMAERRTALHSAHGPRAPDRPNRRGPAVARITRRPDLPIALGGGMAGLPAADGTVALATPPGLDPRPDAVRRQLPRPQGAAARPGPQHGLRGGPLPQHRGVLGPAHRHDHDPGRHVHPGLRVLRRQDRPAHLVR